MPATDHHASAARPSAVWPDLGALDGVAAAVERARSAIAATRSIPENRRGWPVTAAAAAVRAARASAVLDGAPAALSEVTAAGPDSDGIVTDPVLAGALRVNAAVGELAEVWRRAPMQALARLHALAAADLVDSALLGRPRAADGVADRLVALATVVTGAPWPAPVLAAVVHGELLAVEPFGSADGVVARAAARLTMVATGLDPQSLTVPEVSFLRRASDYREKAIGFASGSPAGVARWIVWNCDALRAGARETSSIARARGHDSSPA